ncbi:MAG: hypothetical protein IAF58_05760 [Leptolyngbya sp.]|nr:hypothetical protein [Candidatus Melainabacteria bacterium]
MSVLDFNYAGPELPREASWLAQARMEIENSENSITSLYFQNSVKKPSSPARSGNRTVQHGAQNRTDDRMWERLGLERPHVSSKTERRATSLLGRFWQDIKDIFGQSDRMP